MAVFRDDKVLSRNFDFATNRLDNRSPFGFGFVAVGADQFIDLVPYDFPTSRCVGVRRVFLEELANFACPLFFLFQLFLNQIDFKLGQSIKLQLQDGFGLNFVQA